MPERLPRLNGKVAIITGAGTIGPGVGNGKATAILFAREGAKVLLVDIVLEAAEETLKLIEEDGGFASTFQADVSNAKECENMVETCIKRFGRLDILVNNVGISSKGDALTLDESEWDQVMDVHLNGTYNVVRAASPIFKKQGSGRIITFSSVSGLYGYAGQSNYGAAKEAIAGFTRSISEDMRVYGVTANIISPGAQTRMIESIPDSTKDMRKGSFGLPPGWLPRNKPEDVAPMIAWLSSDEASDVTGQIFHCVGNSVSLMNTPKSTRVINKDGRWSVEEISGIFEETLGMDLINPAPPND